MAPCQLAPAASDRDLAYVHFTREMKNWKEKKDLRKWGQHPLNPGGEREREREPKTQPEKPSSVGVRPLAGESEAEHEGVMATPEASCKVNVHQVCTQVECTQHIKGSPGRSIPWV